jgi:hypothetical protein
MKIFHTNAKGKSNVAIIKATALDALRQEGIELSDVIQVLEPRERTSTEEIPEGKVKNEVEEMEAKKEAFKAQFKEEEPNVRMSITPVVPETPVESESIKDLLNVRTKKRKTELQKMIKKQQEERERQEEEGSESEDIQFNKDVRDELKTRTKGYKETQAETEAEYLKMKAFIEKFNKSKDLIAKYEQEQQQQQQDDEPVRTKKRKTELQKMIKKQQEAREREEEEGSESEDIQFNKDVRDELKTLAKQQDDEPVYTTEQIRQRLKGLRIPRSNDRVQNVRRVQHLEEQRERTKHDVRPSQTSYESETRKQNNTTQSEPAIVDANSGLILRNPILIDGNTEPVYAQEARNPQQQNDNNAREEERYDEDIERAEYSQFRSQQIANAILVNEGSDRARNIEQFYGQISNEEAAGLVKEQLDKAREEVEGRRAELDELKRRYNESPNLTDGERQDILRTYAKQEKNYKHAYANLTEAQQEADLNEQVRAVPDLPINEVPQGIEGFQQYDARAQSLGFTDGKPTNPQGEAPLPSSSSLQPIGQPPNSSPQEGQGDVYTYDISNFLNDGGGPSGALSNITQTEQNEQNQRMNMSTERLKQEIKALLMVYRPLVSVLRDENLTKQARDVLRTTDRTQIIGFHKYITDIVRSYYGQSQLKVGVIVAPGSLGGGGGGGGGGATPGEPNLGQGSFRLTKSGNDQFTHTQFGSQEVMRGGRNSFKIMENRVPISRPENAPIPRRIPQFLTRSRHPFPNLLFSNNPMAGMDLSLKPPSRRRSIYYED